MVGGRLVAYTLEETKRVFEESPFFKLLGFKLVEFEEGQVTIELPVDDHLLNANKTVHGGVYASLLDNIIGATIRSIVKVPLATINLNIHYIASIANGVMVAKATILQQGYRMVTGEAEIRDGQGQLLAKGTATFKVLRKQSYS